MLRVLISVVSTILFPLFAITQEEVDTSLWELVIPVSITDSKPMMTNIVTLNRKEFLSLPASFDDPSRLLTKFPGFSNANDQNNSIVYHGMPGYMSGWTLFNSEIINPNHLNRAGNIMDGYSPSSGGVNAFSGQVIGEFSYRANPDIHRSNDYFAGVSNMNLRSPYKNAINLNTSLIGMELGLDAKKEAFDLLFNFRYSTVGLLSDLGLDFGDESITYNDAMMKLGLNLGKGKANFYGLYGSSENNKQALPFNQVENIVDATFKDFQNDLFIAGFNYELETLDGHFETTFNFSSEDQELQLIDPSRNWSEMFNKKMLSTSSSYTDYMGKWDVEYNFRTKFYGDKSIANYLSQLGVFSRYYHSNHLILNFGISGLMNSKFDLPTDFINRRINPSLGINLISKDFKHTYRFKFSRNQQIGVAHPITRQEFPVHPSSYNFLLEYQSQEYNLVASMFYHYFDKVFQNPGSYGQYVYFDDYERLESFSFGEINAAFGHIYGASFSISNQLSENIGLKLNTTFLKGFQRAVTNYFVSEERIYKNIPIPYSLRYNNNLMLTWDKFLSKKLQLSFALTHRDGQNVQKVGVFDDPYSERLPYYFRADARLNYRFKMGKIESMLSLDMQNLSNRKNITGQYFDTFADEILSYEQLGFIPILSWRIVI